MEKLHGKNKNKLILEGGQDKEEKGGRMQNMQMAKWVTILSFQLEMSKTLD